MENSIELFVTELFAAIKRRQILRDEIAAIAAQILKITGRRVSGNFSCNASVRLEPMKPAPPVTRKLRDEFEAITAAIIARLTKFVLSSQRQWSNSRSSSLRA